MIIRKIIIIILAVIIFFNINTYVYATSNKFADPNPDIIGTAKNWITMGENGNVVQKPKWTDFNGLADMLWGAGIFVILIAGTILGIKYMLSSVEEKASIKESMTPYIIGSIIILGALSIWKLCISIASSM